ncbi:divalent-cation tolerance protein CutA [soil metagenome]
MNDPKMLYVTTRNRDEARRIGEIIVKERLCACVNIINNMESVYWWDGQIQSNTESILIVKTTGSFVDSITDRIKKMHSYDVPCVISLPLSPGEGNREYIEWIEECVSNNRP